MRGSRATHPMLHESAQMKLDSLLELLVASHLSYWVKGPGFDSRGGVMLVANPESLKTQILKQAYKPFHDAIILNRYQCSNFAGLA